MRYETLTLPAVPASADERAGLLADGYTETRVGQVLVFKRAASPAGGAAGDGQPLPPASDEQREGEPDADRAEIVGAVGTRAADALAAQGFHTLEHARSAHAAAPEAFAKLPGVGPATLRKIEGA